MLANAKILDRGESNVGCYGLTTNNVHNVCVLFRNKGVLREFRKEYYYSSADYRVVVDFPNDHGYECDYSKLEKVSLLKFEVSVEY